MMDIHGCSVSQRCSKVNTPHCHSIQTPAPAGASLHRVSLGTRDETFEGQVIVWIDPWKTNLHWFADQFKQTVQCRHIMQKIPMPCDIMWYILCNPVQCCFCIKRRKCRRIDPKCITDWKDGDQYFNKDGNPDGNRATTFSIGRQDRTSKSRHAKPKNKFDSTNAQQSLDYLITVPGPEDEFNAAVWIKDLND